VRTIEERLVSQTHYVKNIDSIEERYSYQKETDEKEASMMMRETTRQMRL